jgi:hypothetical protein
VVDLRALPPDLQHRYGVAGRRSTISMILVGLVAAALVVASGWTAWTLANPAVRSKLLTWSVEPDHARVTWEVRRNGTAEVVCVIRVADANRHDVGYATVTIPPGADYEQPTYEVRTRAPGRIVELLGCAAGGVPVVESPQFPPGTENPPQPWTPEGQT